MALLLLDNGKVRPHGRFACGEAAAALRAARWWLSSCAASSPADIAQLCMCSVA